MPSAHSARGQGAGLPLILATLLAWASVPLFLKYFVVHLDGWEANGWRYGLSAAFWLPLLALAFFKGNLPKPIFVAALIPAAFNLVGQSAFAWCPYFMDPGFFSFVFRVQIVFVTLGAWVLFPAERATLRSPRFWLGAGLVVAGSAGLILFKSAPPPAPDGPAALAHAPTLAPGTSLAFAIPLAIASGALFAGYGLAVRKFMHRYSPVLAFGVICQYTAVGTIILMLVLGRSHGAAALAFSPFNWFMLIASSMIGIAISHVLYYAALARLGVSVSMGIIQLQPVLTGVASMFLFNEQLNVPQWSSGLVGVVGAVLILTSGRPTGSPVERTPEGETCSA
ncbi:MAG: DMT family transporter [Phycisphaerae bacterium]|nr:DMT family transporter [Phycisphaerae bacterium]